MANEPIPSPEDEYQLLKRIAEMPALNVNAINMYVKELISDKDSNLVVSLFEQEKAGKQYITEAQLANVIKNVRAEKLEAWVDNVKQEPLLDETKLPKAGKIVKETENKVLGYKVLTLSNGARVLLKKTDYKDNEIQFTGYSKGGKSLYGAADFDNLKLFDIYLSTCGLGNFTNQELSKALAGKEVNMNVSLTEISQRIGGSCVPKDVETMMQLAYLHFTDIRKDEAELGVIKAQLETALKNKDLSPEAVYSDSLTYTITGHNPRFSPLQLSTVQKANIDRILQIWKERFASPGQFTYMFVGNFDEATLRPLIEKYLACLPTGKAENFVQYSRLVDGKVSNKFTRKSETPKAIAFEFWRQPASYTLENSVLADAAGQVLSMVYLKDIREDASAAYSVGAGGSLSKEGNKSYIQIQAYCPMDPTKSDLAVKLLHDGFKNNTMKIDTDKLQKVKDNMLKNADIDAKSNNHWASVIEELDRFGVDFHTDYKKVVNAMTPEKLANFLKGVYQSGNQIEVVMTPAK